MQSNGSIACGENTKLEWDEIAEHGFVHKYCETLTIENTKNLVVMGRNERNIVMGRRNSEYA